MKTRLRFLGAAENVTGSCILLETASRRLLVDCGLYQERRHRQRNWKPFPVDPSSLDAVLLTHAHLDHCGLLPKLVKEGFSAPVYCTPATAEIVRILLLDSARIQEEDAQFKRRRHLREGRTAPFPELPLYTVRDAEQTLPHLRGVGYGQSLDLGGGLQASFFEAGHILGSSMIRIRLGGEGRTIVFSGDIGQWDKPIIEDPTLFSSAEYLVMESTYGDRNHEDPGQIEGLLAEVVNSTCQAGGKLLIPSFALERTQELLYFLSALRREKRIPPVMVFVDSPMAVSVTEVFKNHPELFDRQMRSLVAREQSPFDFPGLSMTRSVEQSKSINDIRGSAIVIAGSGMCTGGRIKHHLARNIGRKESTILFVGYQAEGTLGREILAGARQVRIHGQMHGRKARITQIGGFSAHADQAGLLRWLSGLQEPPRTVFLTHGEPLAIQALSEKIEREKGYSCFAPEYGQTVELG